MFTPKRLSVVMSVFGAGLVIAACATPTDAEIADGPAQQNEDVEASGESTDAEDIAATTAELSAEDKEEESVSQEQRSEQPGAYGEEEGYGQPGYGGAYERQGREGYGQPGYGRPEHGGYGGPYGGRRCDFRDAWHCRRGHPGWRWVSRGHHPGYGGGYDREGRCCVRVHVRDHRGERW